MKYFTALLPLLIVLASCSSSEELVDNGESKQEEEVSPAPEWYDGSLYSAADSVSFYGFSMASSVDSAEALRLSHETALNNLRFEIDNHAEDTRRLLSDDNADYASASFIIELRTAIRNADLSGAKLESGHEKGNEGVHYIYTRATLHRRDFVDVIENRLADSSFLDTFLYNL